MILIEQTVPADADLALHGDTHWGDKFRSHKKLDLFRRWVRRRKNRYFVHMGDEADYIMSSDRRYNRREVEMDYAIDQAKSVERFYRGIADRCLVWLNGNHPHTLQRVGNFTKMICDDLGVPYGTWTTKLRLVTPKGKQICKLYLAHGIGKSLTSRAKDYEQRIANMKASLKRRMVPLAGDCLIMAMGHTHKLLVAPPAKRLVLTDDGEEILQSYTGIGDGAAGYIEPDARFYVNTGSFVKLHRLGVDGYAERAGYDPIELGYVKVRIRHGKVEAVEPVTV